MRRFILPLCSLVLIVVPAYADEAVEEIEYLLTTVGASGCTFQRNGKAHSAEDAEAHLRMKYKSGNRHASTTEKFIERLASASSWTGKPYFIECPGSEPVKTGDWFMARLLEYRSASSEQVSQSQ